MSLTISVLLENKRSLLASQSLLVRPGLSLLLQDGETTILFDTGPDGSFQQNAKGMGIDLSEVDLVVLSHGHYDHCGGVPWLPARSRIVCHPRIARERFAVARMAGLTRKIKRLSRANDYSQHQMEYSAAPKYLSDRFLWSGEIPVADPHAYGAYGDHLSETDYVVDEGVLIYKSSRGLVIVTGCGHRGITNIIHHCQNITGTERIHALIGGFHLRCASPLTLWRTRRFLSRQKPDTLYGCHCTGVWGRLWLPDMIVPATGDVLHL
ncbi:MBL fold metallo-hydrolase (plasmid) [Salmonella enterica subsp. enterica serovar Karamoja]|uniref:MBL fold metallo-hydrolase n=1 Tax=Salmonella enterica subsp. enterica serovar Karamoja TaxID=2500153 RepID=A0A3Q9MSK2_SALET|nr:MBL fold metallo-hydrolase [Salmonella enterica]AZT39640.1 MBL fold metallo-hydrolase [Salmonella enterica subsp. enterica serovar Karamoja]AZT44467.1 MBL fold metallo-hydrolase [Salmonella enterica subsp. enterica serovar Karamoja]